MTVSTAMVWVCGKCGWVSHVDGTPGLQHNTCLRSPDGRHALKPVLVMVPWA